ncbi:MAG: UDP-N-acetylmuramoyl-tripeptide--D-alanyl-D-alanine ligase [Tepidiformaceae bacterium]
MTGGLSTAFVAREMSARGYTVIAGAERPITGGAADSRKVLPGDLFTAFPGENADGNDFVAGALDAGAAAAICERAPAGAWPAATIVVAPDATRAVGELAKAWRVACAPRVVGITGTVGKTTAKELTAGALSTRFRTHRSTGNLNSREGLPLALMSLCGGHEVSVLEMGMDSRGEIRDLCEIAAPSVGVVLNIGLTHIEKLGSIEAIEEEKLALARFLPGDGTAVLNTDDERIARAAPGLECRMITFGQGEEAMLRRGPVTAHGLAGCTFEAAFGGHSARIESPLPGEHVAAAALAATGVCMALGMPFAEAAAAVGQGKVEGRVHPLASDTGATIIDDRYNSSPASLAGALRMLAALPGGRIAFLGRMAELGAFEEEEHRTAGRIAAVSCDTIVAVGESCRALAEAAREAGHPDVRWFAGKDEAARAVRKLLQRGDHVLVKASRAMAFETILPVLEGRP